MQTIDTSILKKQLMRYTVFGILGVCLIISAFSVYHSYEHANEDIKKELEFSLTIKSLAIEEFVSKVKDVADQITSRSRMRQLLEDYNDKKISLDQYQKANISKLGDAMHHSDIIAGISRFDRHNSLVAHVGTAVPEAHKRFSSGTQVYGPLVVGGNRVLAVSATIKKNANRVGTDIVLFRMERLDDILTQGLDPQQRQMFVMQVATDAIQYISPAIGKLPTEVSRSLQTDSAQLTGQGEVQLAEGTTLYRWSRLKNSGWAIVLLADKSSLFEPVYEDLRVLFGITLILILAGTALISMRLHPITGQVIMHTEELRQAMEAAEDASRSKSEFLANMSHEIRTPLNGVLGMLHILENTPLDHKQKRFVETAAGSSEMLLTVINDILDFSKMEAGKLELESIPFNPTMVMEDTVALMANDAHDKGLELICSARTNLPAMVMGDPTRLRQVLTNLVSNAIKFTSEGQVVLYATPFDDGIRFGVVDTGIGMTPEQQAAVFSAFTQADSSHTRKYGGTGLGLAISKRLVDAMGGQLHVAGGSGVGSDFSFNLPMPVVDEKLFNKRNSMLLPQQHILVVDDNKTNLEVIKHILESWNITNIDLVTNGIDALQQLRAAAESGQPYDIALLDMQMPQMTGIELARAIRTDGALRGISLVMLSSLDRHEPAPELDAWVTKPVRQSELYNSLMMLLGEHELVNQESDDIPQTNNWWFGGQQLLLVEDNLINQEVAREILSDVGFDIDTRENGEEALQAVQEKSYDVVLMDIQMPVMDGIEATKQIRALGGHFKDIPIIAMTAHALSGDSDKSMAVGMDAHVTKPINPDDLYKTLSRWIAPCERPVQAIHSISADTVDDALPDLPGINVADGLMRLLNKKAAYIKILKAFQKKQENIADVIQAHIVNEEWDEATYLAHSLKGSSGNIGAEGIYHQASALEQICKQHNQDEALVRMESLRTHLDEVIEGLDLLQQVSVSTPSNAALASMAPEDLYHLLEQIEVHLDTDLGQAQNYFEELEKQVSAGMYAETFTDLEQALNSFDMDMAKEVIQTFKQQLMLENKKVLP